MDDMKSKVTIKGTKDGLQLFIDDACPFDEAYEELAEKMRDNEELKEEPSVPVTVKLGYRYLHQEQRDKITDVIERTSNFMITHFDSELIRKEDALAWKEESEVKVYSRIIRSGQVLDVTGDLLLIGDVNPGGEVVTTGNTYVMGNLSGIAHAGSNGDEEAIIAASYMKPSQLRIAGYISRAPDYDSEGVYMEYGRIDKQQDKIIIDQLQVLSHKRLDISGFERRMQNG